MTTEQKYQAVAQAIRQALPRLMELEEGCVIKHKKLGFLYSVKEVISDSDSDDYLVVFSSLKESYKSSLDSKYFYNYYEIIGKEPTLTDVLEWLNIFYSNEILFDISGYILFHHSKGMEYDTNATWDLSSPYLKDQSDELIDFLYNLIK